MSLAQHSQANIDRNTDQGALVIGGSGDLITLGLTQRRQASIHGDIDQSIAGGLLVALGLSEDGRAESDWDAEEALGGGNSLHNIWSFSNAPYLKAILSTLARTHGSRGRKGGERSYERLLHNEILGAASDQRWKSQKEWTPNTARKQ